MPEYLSCLVHENLALIWICVPLLISPEEISSIFLDLLDNQLSFVKFLYYLFITRARISPGLSVWNKTCVCV